LTSRCRWSTVRVRFTVDM